MIEAKEIDGELWIKALDHHQSVKKAIEHEREACAKIADEWAVGWPHPAKTIALDIRARGQA